MAAPDKKGPTPDDIMAPAQMKPLLALSKREPVNAAMGITADKLGVLFLHKLMKPKKALAELRTQAKKIQLGIESPSLRFGTAEVDPEVDSALVRFRINKEPPGVLGPKLRELLKKSGFSKVEFIVDPSLEVEEGEEGEPDWNGLMAELMALAKSIPAAAAGDAARQQSLVQLAGTAGAGAKARQDFPAARAAVEALREALQGGGTGTEAAMPVWQAAKDMADDQLRALSDALRKTGIPELQEVSADVESLLEQVRVKLAAALLNYDSAPAKPEARAAALSALTAAGEWLASDERVRAVDGNGFGVPVSVGATVGAALGRLQRELAGKAGAGA